MIVERRNRKRGRNDVVVGGVIDDIETIKRRSFKIKMINHATGKEIVAMERVVQGAENVRRGQTDRAKKLINIISMGTVAIKVSNKITAYYRDEGNAIGQNRRQVIKGRNQLIAGMGRITR